MATAIADGHSVMGRAGDGAGGQVDAELVLGEAVGVAYRRHLGAHVMAPLGLLVQSGPVGVGRIPVNLKVFDPELPSVPVPVSASAPGPSVAGSASAVRSSVSVAGWSAPGSFKSSSMTSRSGVLAAVTATLVISSSSGSTFTWVLYPSKVRARDLCPWRACTSTVEISRSRATV